MPQDAPKIVGAADAHTAYVRTFNRYELKYLLDYGAADALIADLATHCVPDPHSGERGYTLHSIYWDSPDLRFFWEKLDGEKYRRKLRFRRYDDASDNVFVEIKQRIDRTVQKRRALVPLGKVLALFRDGEIDCELEYEVVDPVLQEALFLARTNRLAPKISIRYRRRAFFARYEPDLRITFDTRLQYEARDLDLARPFETGKYLLEPERTVLEIKYNHRVPTWLIALVQKHGLEVVRFSKYCAAVDREFFDGRYI